MSLTRTIVAAVHAGRTHAALHALRNCALPAAVVSSSTLQHAAIAALHTPKRRMHTAAPRLTTTPPPASSTDNPAAAADSAAAPAAAASPSSSSDSSGVRVEIPQELIARVLAQERESLGQRNRRIYYTLVGVCGFSTLVYAGVTLKQVCGDGRSFSDIELLWRGTREEAHAKLAQRQFEQAQLQRALEQRDAAWYAADPEGFLAAANDRTLVTYIRRQLGWAPAKPVSIQSPEQAFGRFMGAVESRAERQEGQRRMVEERLKAKAKAQGQDAPSPEAIEQAMQETREGSAATR